ncbi:hypothetical protein FDP41_000550 [Naegleria fowleri]|uniref:AMP-dependent synthetase/ligase domain-containing protein n=1 Tax=Naegleria fowleri TaxID=5763 RepID=A0A6A5CBJ9_NAEFO|nr:uncharacterized protein FDP41_000550 [Naegleria fowleri]KAF0984651.1 hypothetical protein FDP41_000550 [Naegleria fowleri]CAG4709514.1 unnamed protein product [Naegleria fowleri]
MSEYSAFAESLSVSEDAATSNTLEPAMKESEKVMQQEENPEVTNSSIDAVEKETTVENKLGDKEVDVFVKQVTEMPAATEASSSTTEQQPKDSTEQSQFIVPELKGLKTITSSAKSYPPITQQTVPMKDNSRIRRKNGHADALVLKRFEDISTLYDAFKKAVEKYGDRPCFGDRKRDPTDPSKLLMEYEFITFKQVDEMASNLASGLRHLGTEPNQHLAIYSKNRKEWQISVEACNKQSLVSLALYDTLGEESSAFIMNHGEVVVLCCSGEVMPNVMKLAPKSKMLKHIICFDYVTEEQTNTLEKNGIKLYTFQQVLEMGKNNPCADVPPSPQSIACLNYTSGTTGLPKGVIITHFNFIAASAGITHNIIDLNENDCVISYLPLAHILERMVEIIFLQHGASIGFWSGNIKTLKDDLAALKPTAFPAVPRVLDKLYDGIKEKISKESKLKQWALNKAIKSKEEGMISGKSTPIADIVLGVVRKNFGGRIRFVLSGGAPIRPEVQAYMRVIFGCNLVQGYGLTETCAASTIQLAYDYSEGHIGCIVPSVEIKLDDVEEMNYTVEKNNSGEICVRGPSVSMGYYKDPEKTKEAWDEEGWFHTGDIGRYNENGTITIIDRKKNIFKLSQGEYIAAENIEQKLAQTKYINGIWVYGDSFKSCLVGFVVGNIPQLQQYAKEHGKQELADKIEELCEDADINKMVLAELTNTAKQHKLKGFEMVKAIKILPKEFDQYGCMTPTMKLVRNKMKELFQTDIDKLYETVPDA